MGRHALPAAPDDRSSRPARTPDGSSPVPRGRRSAAHGPVVARSTYVQHERPARVVAMPTVRSTVSPDPAPVTRLAALRAERATDPRHVRRAVTMKRAAVLLAPALAITSSLTLAVPANAAPVDTTSSVVDQVQHFTVAKGVDVPVIDNGTVSVVSYPSLVVSGGATVDQAKLALSAVLSQGGDRATIVQTALAYLGDPYVEGGASHAGIDCSGLTMVAYQAVGIQLAHYVPTQDAVATTIPASEALPGDLVVYDNEDHVGLYLGNDLVLQAPHPGEPVDIIPMFSAAHHFARVLPAGS